MRKYKFKVVDKNDGSCVVHWNSIFHIRYPKNKNVYAHGDSLGVMVFHTREDAKNFISIHLTDVVSEFSNKAKYWKIKRVLPIGRGKTPSCISKYVTTYNLKEFTHYLKEFSPHINNSRVCSPIANTICYPGVHVID